ncbi:hypothetical protein GOZ97_00045 [Agrobacterium vitis]|uniref:hypothetical protein n=1 Tax=Rhizobium/Agrobacterium group TaxID=227290 RepID=UPI0008DBFAAE|nr:MULTISPECIES: hypothetical protein [Rhizobium/Agrobacterium group]MCF1436969.1 hypothetical protein [Allorhizobium ampelinum]MCF1474595.1 hypothetical protein [Allorhizobium ampelinum]MUO92555.1 hypothetical protein [Agrobacterium vitis]MUZ51984.1 hypothetical protein [Agrobacterium vitis]MUZ89799.1 hypothetical protein [Agrobacterium vitis]
MKSIIPLAGPGFVNPDGSVKSETIVDGLPLLRRALESRHWWSSGLITDKDLIFILRDDPQSHRFHQEKLAVWYPLCRCVFLSHYTKGAAFSVLGACGLLENLSETICFDLADILFQFDQNPTNYIDKEGIGALALTFYSNKEIYSYLRRDENNRVVEAAEKRVISNEASAGVYFFKSISVYLKALAMVLESGDRFTHRGLHFICPVFNGVLSQGLSVEAVNVDNVQDIKL